MRAPQRRDGGNGTRGHDAAADGRAALRRVVHTIWGTRRVPAGALSPRTEGQPAACWGRRERHMARSRLLRSRQARRAEETSTPQEDVDALRGPERRRLQKRTDLTIPHSPCDMPDDEAETCDGVRVWELPY